MIQPHSPLGLRRMDIPFFLIFPFSTFKRDLFAFEFHLSFDSSCYFKGCELSPKLFHASLG